MKQILEKMFVVLCNLAGNPISYSPAIKERLDELHELIDNYSEADLTDREREAAEEIIGRCE